MMIARGGSIPVSPRRKKRMQKRIIYRCHVCGNIGIDIPDKHVCICAGFNGRVPKRCPHSNAANAKWEPVKESAMAELVRLVPEWAAEELARLGGEIC